MSKVINIDLDEVADPEAESTLTIQIGDEQYPVYPPKDSLPILIAELDQRMREDPKVARELVQQALYGVMDEDDANAVLDRVFSVRSADRRFTVKYAMHIIQVARDHYKDLIESDLADVELAGQKPGRQPQDRRSKAPAKRAATSRTAAAAH